MPGNLTHLSGVMVHPHGQIAADLHFEDGHVRGAVTLPSGVHGRFHYAGKTTALQPGAQSIDSVFQIFARVGIYCKYILIADCYAMKTAKLFQNGQSQAVRLPKEFRFAGKEVYIQRRGNAVVLLPMDAPWQTLLASLELFTADFSAE